MTLDQIRAFLEVQGQGSFAGAANALYLTQSALGHRISSLEKELGYELFVRGRGIRQVTLTDKGAAFIPIATQLEDLWRQALALGDPERREEVRIAGIFSLESIWAERALELLVSNGYRPFLSGSNTSNAVRSIEDGEIDFAVVGYGDVFNPEKCAADVLARESFVMISRDDSPYGEEVSIHDMDPTKEIYSRWHDSCVNWHQNVFGDSFAAVFSIENVAQIGPLLKADAQRWSIAPSGAARDLASKGGVKVSRFSERTPEREIRLLSHLPLMKECHKLLVDGLKEQFASMEGFSVPE